MLIILGVADLYALHFYICTILTIETVEQRVKYSQS